MILLGVNVGCNNSDLRNMMFADIDLNTGWLDYVRIKTGEERRAKLWDETVEAISVCIQKRKEPKDDEHKEIVFLTRIRRPWGSDKTGDDPITENFRKLLDSIGMHRPGLSFVSLRHTFRMPKLKFSEQGPLGRHFTVVEGEFSSNVADPCNGPYASLAPKSQPRHFLSEPYIGFRYTIRTELWDAHAVRSALEL